MNDKWKRRFIELAKHISTWSKDPSTQVGAVIVRPDKTIASVGFNGFPRGVDDRPEKLADRPLKYQMIVHAEINAILSSRESLAGCSIFVYPFHPCSQCAAAIIQSGITRVYTLEGAPEWWSSNFTVAHGMFQEAGITIEKVAHP